MIPARRGWEGKWTVQAGSDPIQWSRFRGKRGGAREGHKVACARGTEYITDRRPSRGQNGADHEKECKSRRLNVRVCGYGDVQYYKAY